MKTLKKIFGEDYKTIEYSEALTLEEQDQKDAEEKAQQAIVTAYNDCVKGKSITANDFAIKLFNGDPIKLKVTNDDKAEEELKITDIVDIYVSCRILSQFNGDKITLKGFVENSLKDNTDVFKLNLTTEQKNSIKTKATEAKKTPEEILTGEIQFALQVDGVFKALHSQYGNNEIKDNLAKVEKDPTTWEIIKNFINEYLLAGLFQTNVNDKERYKAHKESFTEKVIQSKANQNSDHGL
jgi:hypothetical protein